MSVLSILDIFSDGYINSFKIVYKNVVGPLQYNPANGLKSVGLVLNTSLGGEVCCEH